MTWAQQAVAAFVHGPAALWRMSKRSWGWFWLYFGLSAVLLLGLALMVASQQDTLERAFMAFVFPEEWHGVVDFFLAFVFRSQAQQVVVNVVLLLTLNVVSLVFFWAKESLSQSYERDLALRVGEDDPRAHWREYPFWYQALEEVKWTLVGLALIFVVLWVGHSAEPWRDVVATILSYIVLFFTAAGNYLAPPLQRRRLQYAQVLKAIFRKPLAAFGFGALVSLPQVLVLHLAAGAQLSALAALLVIFSVNIVFIAWSAVAGTHVGLELLPTAEAAAPSHWLTRTLGWLVIASLLVGGAYIGVRVGRALADKSQLLKCRYAVDWSSLAVATPELGGLLGGKVRVGVSFDVEITNPNSLAVRIEKNRLVASDAGLVIAESHLLPLEVPAHGSRKEHVGLDVELRADSLLKGARINPLRWDITLFVALDEDLELPIYLRAGD